MLLGLIISPDVPNASFADDHYLPDLKREHVKIVGQLPGWADVRWYHDLVRRVGHEVKSRWVISNWYSLDADLRGAADRSIREAVITISDSNLQRLELQGEFQNVAARMGLLTIPVDVADSLNGLIEEQLELGVLLDSPAYAALRYASGDKVDLNKLRRKLGNPHNVRLFGARVAAALAEYLDPDRRAEVIQPFVDDKLYISSDDVSGLYFAEALKPHRTFDKGNSKVLDVIGDILEGVTTRVRENRLILLPDSAGSISEGESSTVPLIAAADVAAGIAGDLYRKSDGLKRVVDRFKMVILNGSVVKL